MTKLPASVARPSWLVTLALAGATLIAIVLALAHHATAPRSHICVDPVPDDGAYRWIDNERRMHVELPSDR